MWQRRTDFENPPVPDRPRSPPGAIAPVTSAISPRRHSSECAAASGRVSRGGRRFVVASVLGVCAVLCAVTASASHEVKAGDSLWALSKRYGVSVEAIQKANGLTSEKIRQGQKLRIPSKDSKATTPKPAAEKSETATRQVAKPATKAGNAPSARPRRSAKAAGSPGASAAKSSVATSSVSVKSNVNSKRLAHPSDMAVLSRFASKRETVPLPRGAKTLISSRQQEDAEQLYASDTLPPPSTLEEIAPRWVLERPASNAQGEKSNAARGGIYPCVAPDPGLGSYSKWVQVAPMAHVLAPTRMVLDAEERFDVVFHFHGREPIRKEWVKSMDQAVLVAIDIGIDSGAYADAYADARTFGSVIRAVEAEIAKRTGRTDARVGNVALSSWSAGFGAIEQILAQPLGQQLVDTVVLLDGLHSGYVGQSLDAQRLEPFIEFAQSATHGNRLLFISHSSISTTGYASTTETAHYLVWKVGGQPAPVEPLPQDPMGLERMEAFSEGDFHVRGFRGSGSADHCAHLGLMRDVLRVHVLPRWQKRHERSSTSPEAVASVVGSQTPPSR